jgi:hypothetical protein
MLQLTAKRGRPRARSLALLLTLLRPLLLLLALQLGGVPHAAVDLLSAVCELREQHEVCPEDGPCSDCPDGCPNCHCANGMRLLVPEASASLLLDPRALLMATWTVTEDEWRPGPVLAPLDRPPRA